MDDVILQGIIDIDDSLNKQKSASTVSRTKILQAIMYKAVLFFLCPQIYIFTKCELPELQIISV